MRYPEESTIIDLVLRLPQEGSKEPTLRMRKAPVIDIREGERLRAEAYEWACEESRGHKTVYRTLVIEGDSMTARDPYRVDELFVGPDGKALLRQLWPKEKKVVYIWVLNFDELRDEVPFYVGYMRTNGVLSYRRHCRNVAA